MGTLLGIDIGGTTSKLGLVREGRVVARARIPTTGHADAAAFADALAAAARELAGSGEGPDAIGIGAPNGNQHTGIIERAPNLPWKEDVPLARMLGQRLGLPAVLGNDASAAAWGEWSEMRRTGRGCDDLLVVTLGTGLGSGFIVGGRLLLGSAGNAGELGHMTLVIGGRECTCGRTGCLEAYVSTRGMLRTLDEAGGPRPADVRGIADLAERGDPAAIACFERTAAWLAVGLANAVCITGPARIVLFGGIARSGELLMTPLRRRFGEALLNIHHGRVELLLSALPEDDAALLGAAALGEMEGSRGM